MSATRIVCLQAILAIDICLSLISIVLYAWDKAAAGGNRRRIPESRLQILAFLGGWPGAAIAQSLFRHKTQKREFQRTFKALTALNVLLTATALGLLLTSYR